MRSYTFYLFILCFSTVKCQKLDTFVYKTYYSKFDYLERVYRSELNHRQLRIPYHYPKNNATPILDPISQQKECREQYEDHPSFPLFRELNLDYLIITDSIIYGYFGKNYYQPMLDLTLKKNEYILAGMDEYKCVLYKVKKMKKKNIKIYKFKYYKANINELKIWQNTKIAKIHWLDNIGISFVKYNDKKTKMKVRLVKVNGKPIQ